LSLLIFANLFSNLASTPVRVVGIQVTLLDRSSIVPWTPKPAQVCGLPSKPSGCAEPVSCRIPSLKPF